MDSLKIISALAVVLLFIVILAVATWRFSHRPLPEPSTDGFGAELLDESSGEFLARQYCVSCHLFPEPDLVPKKSWNFLLTYMGMYLGIDDLRYLDRGTDFEKEVINNRLFIMKNLRLMPPEPALDHEQWERLRHYYKANAPVTALPQAEKPGLIEDEEWFTSNFGHYREKSAINTMVAIDERHQEILIGNMLSSKLLTLNRELRVVQELELPRDIVFVGSRLTDQGADLLSIGDLGGSEPGKYMGAIFRVDREGPFYQPKGPILRGLYRPCFMEFGDLDGDGLDEVVVANFGIESGNVAIYGLDESGTLFDPRPRSVLLTDTGAVTCRFHDFDQDGQLDVATLTSNARENFSIYFNRGNFQFERRKIIEKHSAFGYVDFEIVDLNQDGHPDIVTLNGDNGDNDPYNTLKPYHGLRVYLNDGSLNFEEAFFYPMYGAFGMEIADFDLDGRLDIAVNAFYPDFNAEPPENFVILRQSAPMQFEALTHPDSHRGRWITMDSGDLDGDGDMDIILAAGYVTMGLLYDNKDLLEEMISDWPPLLYLENKTIP